MLEQIELRPVSRAMATESNPAPSAPARWPSRIVLQIGPFMMTDLEEGPSILLYREAADGDEVVHDPVRMWRATVDASTRCGHRPSVERQLARPRPRPTWRSFDQVIAEDQPFSNSPLRTARTNSDHSSAENRSRGPTGSVESRMA